MTVVASVSPARTGRLWQESTACVSNSEQANPDPKDVIQDELKREERRRVGEEGVLGI
jgi:hypothetical protein